MASHKTVTTHRASKKTITAPRTAVTLATATVGSIALLPGLAHADPTPNLNDVKNQVNTLHNQAEQASEAYDQASTNLAALQHKVDQIQARITAEQTQLTNAQSSLGSLAAAQYRAGGVDSSLELMLSAAPDSFLQAATAMNEASSHSTAAMSSAQEIKRQLDQDKAEASADLQQLQKTRDQMAQTKADIDAKEKQAQTLLDSLTPTQQTQYKQQQSEQNQQAQTPPPGLPPAPNARAATAVAFAKAQVGKPYVYGAEGPSSFDCSGLTEAAWAAAGVSMSHSSSAQAYEFPAVSESNIAVGDLVIYYGSMHHVGIYVGGGMVIHAPYPGTTVQYAPINSMPVVRVVRP
ncbi:C40 family peptidase [Catenulispora sp. NL8]|uniref:C40 family peptidase n=1 Tax=Catenulispora pinistramenti TaxID=2705254 RepID=A0ABS5L2N3_9ACTN|nr:C40 family peptidase [Catenulispora pinistramenti]MBS2552556.1 C40 family peptidase [Catenulispora pinistramenti]